MEELKLNIEPDGDFGKRIAELIKSGKTVDEAYQIYHKENQKEE
jgi:hypothetical protein